MNDTEKNLVANDSIGPTKLQNGILSEKKHITENSQILNYVPPDGGTRAWLVLLGSFLCNGILFGVINSYSVLQRELHENLHSKNDTQASSKAALVGSLAISATFMMSAVAGVLTNLIGVRTTTFIGGALTSGGMFLSSFFTENIAVLYFTYGIMYGIGCALAYTPSLAILGHYFKKHIGIVNGIVTSGSSVFTMGMPYIIGFFLEIASLPGTLRLLALLSTVIMGCSIVFKPLIMKSTDKKTTLLQASNIMTLWRNKRYITWAFLIAMSLCGYFVPYVHMSTFVQINFPKDTDAKLPILCIGITSGLGRLIFGYIADYPKVDRVLLQQISFLIIGISTILLPNTAGSYISLLMITLIMGLFDGCFISLLGPIAFDLCGEQNATQAIGFLLGLCSIPLTIGPYIAGIMFDHIGDYDLAFRIAGIPPIVGGIAMFVIRCIKVNNNQRYIEVINSINTEEKGIGKKMIPGRLLTNCKHSSSTTCKGEDKRSYKYSVL